MSSGAVWRYSQAVEYSDWHTLIITYSSKLQKSNKIE